MKIYIAVSLGSTERETLAGMTAADEVWMGNPSRPTEDDHRAFLEAEVVYGVVSAEWLRETRMLRWIQLTGVGVERYRGIDWTRLGAGVVCTNAGDLYAQAMGETVLGGILALSRGIDQLIRLQTARDWQKPLLHPRLRLLAEARVLLLGAGSVNRRLRDLLRPFDCAFTLYARTSGDIHTPTELDRALPQADIVCAALPDLPETNGLIDKERIDRFKPGAIFTNVGRGSLVDEPALIAALHAGRLGGAVLDVTCREPLPPDDPLWGSPRTVLTQHTAGGWTAVILKRLSVFGENLARYRAGEPLHNVVDWKRGY